ncbi:hypothetical protein VB776_09850 [Arcicella sp. DC2W]|uniref:Uncharacterized protein n=1 Tax=Arcicella gelida TaxID=2984195 RepID=A0ABU5S467_9BACT|nr:hypothetical protein [Arcicella sp. DC2W]MEA5403217.1 hypothetical protein [Arcicella sp. DC2W]
MTLPADIEQIFFDTLSGDKTALEFEQWLYADKRLETILNSDDYLDLISYGYKTDNAKYGLFRLLEKHIDKRQLETRRIRKLLTKSLNRNKELPEILMTFYDLYCKGYNFFDSLGLGYGLRVEVPGINNYEETWDDLNEVEQATLLNSFYPDLETEINKVISWLDTGKVILTGIKDEYNHFEYIDKRTELEKQPTGYNY